MHELLCFLTFRCKCFPVNVSVRASHGAPLLPAECKHPVVAFHGCKAAAAEENPEEAARAEAALSFT